MALYRGPGGAGDATNDATSQSILAAESAQQAATSAAAASASASQTATSATNSASSATSSANSATAAASSANSASTSATNAANSATAAQTAQTAAELAETNAETAEANAETAEANATASASLAQDWATKTSGPVAGGEYSSKYNAQLAATSATNAANSATSASTSASAASTSATNAASSATAAASSASAASNSATAAATSETNAANSATAAATSATNAANSATTATTQASNAASSATAAATSASNAATSETNAAASVTSAASSATSASSSATSASNSASSASTSAANAAASAVDAQSSEDAAAAYAASINPANFLTKANNLSDLTNKSTARTNLGVAIGTNVQAYSTELQAISNGGGNAMFKNRIINGAMMIDQRNAGASGTATGYNIDRWIYSASQASKGTWQQNAGAVTPPTGFTKYWGFTSSSAYTVGASEYFAFVQAIEGLNVSDLAWGTANATAITVSFWVRSSLTGTFGGVVANSAFNRCYPYTYTISSANTWEQKTITIAGDTTGTWLTDNGIGLRLYFNLGAGATVSGTAGAWSGTTYRSATGATSVVGTNGATFYITGVQLEKGSTATSFDYRPYGTELALCQRYYSQLGGVAGNDILFAGYNTSGANCALTLSLPVQMRATPTGTKVGTWPVAACGQPSIVATSLDTVSINAVATSSAPVQYGTANTTTYVTLAAEL